MSQRPPKRKQVARACDSCREHRTKCDNEVPCSNCKRKGATCSNYMRETSLPEAARREIQQLKYQVKQLEVELKQERARVKEPAGSHPFLLQTLPYSILGEATPLDLGQSDVEVCANGTEDASGKDPWEGVMVKTARSPNKVWYGPSSLSHFVNCLERSLSSRIPQQESANNALAVNSASMLLHSSERVLAPGSGLETSQSSLPTGEHYLTTMQEEYFLGLYWQSLHCILPIVHESDFKAHYRSLWSHSAGQARAGSPLVDIVLALSMQYGISSMPRLQQNLIISKGDATIAGRWYYRRSQTLLQYEIDNPSLATIQCHLLTCIYLCSATFQNMADSVYGLAVRQAFMLGLHTETPEGQFSHRERELRKRIWSAIYMLDCKINMKLGRPFLLHTNNATPSLPSDEFDIAMDSGSDFAPLDEKNTWLSFSIYHAKLFHAVRVAYLSFFNSSWPAQHQATIRTDPSTQKRYADILQDHLDKLDGWADSVPGPLTNKRADGGQPFSSTESAMVIEPFAPLWIQSQRAILELTYHHLRTNLCRLMLFVDNPSPVNSPAYRIATTAIRHAITLTRLTHQILTSMNVLTGYQEAFQWQWNASMTLIGYLLAYPHVDVAGDAAAAVAQSISIFDSWSESFDVARSAADVIRRLSAQVNFLARQAKEMITATPGHTESLAVAISDHESGYERNELSSLTWDLGLNPVLLQDTMSMVLDVDHWMPLETLLPRVDSA